MTSLLTTPELGSLAETLALQYLQKQGLKLIEKNYACKRGEIDLIMKDEDNVVFVEVRLRNNRYYSSPIASVTLRKQKKLTLAAIHYLCTKRLFNKVNCRFDIVGISSLLCSPEIEWVTNAFPAYPT